MTKDEQESFTGLVRSWRRWADSHMAEGAGYTTSNRPTAAKRMQAWATHLYSCAEELETVIQNYAGITDPEPQP